MISGLCLSFFPLRRPLQRNEQARGIRMTVQVNVSFSCLVVFLSLNVCVSVMQGHACSIAPVFAPPFPGFVACLSSTSFFFFSSAPVHGLSRLSSFLSSPCSAQPSSGRSYVLMTAFPKKVLADESETLEQAGLLKGVVLQKYN